MTFFSPSNLFIRIFHNIDFFFGQAVEVVYEVVDLFVGGVDLPPD